MRIRKNVRLSSFMPAELIKPYDCQLNQSPWDVIDFSDETESNLRQLERENNFTEEGGCSDNFNGDLSGSGAAALKEKVVVHVEEMDTENESGLKELGEKNMRCCKITNDDDGDDDLIIEKIAATKLTPAARRSRSSGATKGSTSNTNQEEFYYYSGFGPSWIKKRSAQANNSISVNIFNSDSVVVIDDGKDDQNDPKNRDTGKAEVYHKVDGNDDDDDDETENGSRKRKKSVRARSLLSLM